MRVIVLDPGSSVHGGHEDAIVGWIEDGRGLSTPMRIDGQMSPFPPSSCSIIPPLLHAHGRRITAHLIMQRTEETETLNSSHHSRLPFNTVMYPSSTFVSSYPYFISSNSSASNPTVRD